VEQVSLRHLDGGPDEVTGRRLKCRPSIATVDQDVLHGREVFLIFFKGFERSGTISDVGCSDQNCVGNPLSVHGKMSLDPGDLFPRIVPFNVRGFGVFDTLRINDDEGRLGGSAIFYTRFLPQFFLRRSQGPSSSRRGAGDSISGSNCARSATSGTLWEGLSIGTRSSRHTEAH